MDEMKEIINNKTNIRDINSSYIIKQMFSFLSETHMLNMIIYNKELQKTLLIDLEYYKNKSGKYKIGGKNGNGREYIINTNKLIFEGEYLNGKRNGKGKEYYKYGKIEFEGEYLNGKKNGKGKEFYDNGKLKFKGEYINGKRWNGNVYNNNGIIEFKTKNGNGKGKEYNEDGYLDFEGEFLNGERNGKGKEYYYDNGNLEFEGEYLNGKRWNGNGYKEGKIIKGDKKIFKQNNQLKGNKSRRKLISDSVKIKTNQIKRNIENNTGSNLCQYSKRNIKQNTVQCKYQDNNRNIEQNAHRLYKYQYSNRNIKQNTVCRWDDKTIKKIECSDYKLKKYDKYYKYKNYQNFASNNSYKNQSLNKNLKYNNSMNIYEESPLKKINKKVMTHTVNTSLKHYYSKPSQRIKRPENVKYLNKLNISNIQLSIKNTITKKYFYKINKVFSFSITKNEKEKYKILNKEISFSILYKPKKNYKKELVNMVEILKKENKFYQEKDFRNIELLSEGGFGKIYSSFSIKDNQEVCLKRINLDIMKHEYKKSGYPDDSYDRDLKNEIELLKLFSNQKNSVKYYGDYNKIIEKTIIMEKCDDDLEHFLKKREKSFSSDEIKNIFIDINEIFKIMQQKAIIHRDLKLSNFLVKYLDEEKSKYIIKLSDYGIGKFLNKSNIFSGYKGTNEYMAPEMVLQKMKEYKNNYDIFSLGIILYQLAHNLSHPFKRIEDQNLLIIYCNFYDKDNYVIEFDESIKSEEYKDLVKRMLKLNPKNRLNWSQYFEHPFFKK